MTQKHATDHEHDATIREISVESVPCRFELWRDGFIVAEGRGSKEFVLKDGFRWAAMFDGPCELRFFFQGRET